MAFPKYGDRVVQNVARAADKKEFGIKKSIHVAAVCLFPYDLWSLVGGT